MNSNAPRHSADRWCLLILIISVGIIFCRACGFEFISWDDPSVISGNANLLNPTFESLLQIWKKPDPGLYIPLTYTLWWGLAVIARVTLADGSTGLNPWIFHAANVLVHAASVLMLFQLLRKLKFESWPACAGAMVFALHPLQVESVAWATGMRDVLGGALAIAMLVQYVNGRFTLATILMLLATLAKPTSIMLLPMVALLDLWIFKLPVKHIVRRCVPFAIVALLGAGCTLWAQPQIHPNISVPWQRPLIAFDAIAFYLYKLVLPINLVFDYSRKPANIVANGMIWWTWIIPVLLAIIIWRVRSRWVQVASIWFVLPLLPVLGLVPFAFQSISTVADHYVYLGMIGPAMLVAIIAGRVSRSSQIMILGACTVVLGTLTTFQLSTWRDDTAFFQHATRVNPRSAPAHHGLASLQLREGNLPEAEKSAALAIAADPDYAFAHFTMLGIKLRLGDRAGAEKEMNEFLRTYQNQANADPQLAEAFKSKIEHMNKR